MTSQEQPALLLAEAIADYFMQWLDSQGLVKNGAVQLPGGEIVQQAQAFGAGFSYGSRFMLRSGLARCSTCKEPGKPEEAS